MNSLRFIGFSDVELERRIESLKAKIRSWAEHNELWGDCCFKSWAEHYNDEPPQCPCALLLRGPLFHKLRERGRAELLDEFAQLVAKTDFHLEFADDATASFSVVDNEELAHAYRDYYEWRWILDLIKPDYCDLYHEIYERFRRKPSDLHSLEWRQFEQLLDAIFRNNGYTTKLGLGSDDGGVDIRLYSNDIIGEAVTLVQAKRYSKSRPIKLEAVQALCGAVEDERANRGLFVTTSRYLFSAQKFAARQNHRIELATSSHVQEWCDFAAKRIIRDKSTLLSPQYIKSVLEGKVTGGLIGKVFHASTGCTMIKNEFAVVVKESKGAALLVKLPSITKNGKRTLTGFHIPALDASRGLNGETVFRAKKGETKAGMVSLRGDRKYFTLWDGSPQYFDYCD